MDERTAEVVRIAKVLAQHAAAVEGKTAAEAAQQPPDPYDVLGLAEDTTAGGQGWAGLGWHLCGLRESCLGAALLWQYASIGTVHWSGGVVGRMQARHWC